MSKLLKARIGGSKLLFENCEAISTTLYDEESNRHLRTIRLVLF